MATTINAGRVRFVSRGTYNNSTQYYLFDLVDYNGSSYIAKENSLGNLPTNTQYWQLIAEKGNTGNDGQTGPVGPTGNGIASITKTGTDGLVDTYTITYTNGNTTTFTITNGEDGEVTETELDVLRQKLENQQKVIDQLPQVTGQGTSITLENTIEATFTIFDVEGNSVQDGTPSPDNEVPIYSAGDNKNLLPNNISTQTKNGVAITKNNDGTLTFNGASTEGFVLQVGTVTIGEDGEYTLSGCPSGGSLQSYFIYNMAGTPDVTDIGNGRTKALNKNDYLNMYINIRANQTFNDLVFKPKLEKGNKASGYSPYGMGSINEKIQTKNFLPNVATSQTKNGIDFTIYDDGTVKANGTSTGYAIITIANIKLPRGNYILNGCPTGGGGSTYLLRTQDGVNISNVFDTGSGANISITEKSGSADIKLQISPNVTINNLIFKPMIRLASVTDDTYVPHEEQDYSIFVQQPMRSIGDVRDIFFKNTVDSPYYDENLTLNGWYERHLPYIASYNGETLPQDVYNEVDNVKYCNEKSMSTTGQFSIGASVQYIDENNWNDLPCTETQIQQLENKPSTYKDFTIIQSQDETPAYLEVAGIYDLNKLINN